MAAAAARLFLIGYIAPVWQATQSQSASARKKKTFVEICTIAVLFVVFFFVVTIDIRGKKTPVTICANKISLSTSANKSKTWRFVEIVVLSDRDHVSIRDRNRYQLYVQTVRMTMNLVVIWSSSGMNVFRVDSCCFVTTLRQSFEWELGRDEGMHVYYFPISIQIVFSNHIFCVLALSLFHTFLVIAVMKYTTQASKANI